VPRGLRIPAADQEHLALVGYDGVRTRLRI